jgi:hypothetical protein
LPENKAPYSAESINGNFNCAHNTFCFYFKIKAAKLRFYKRTFFILKIYASCGRFYEFLSARKEQEQDF